MPKGYWIAHVDVHDPEGFKEYQRLNVEPFKEYGARFLVRGGATTELIGKLKPRHVVIEFESVEQARACHDSPGYRAAAAVRDRYATVDVVIVEGYTGPQPNG